MRGDRYPGWVDGRLLHVVLCPVHPLWHCTQPSQRRDHTGLALVRGKVESRLLVLRTVSHGDGHRHCAHPHGCVTPATHVIRSIKRRADTNQGQHRLREPIERCHVQRRLVALHHTA